MPVTNPGHDQKEAEHDEPEAGRLSAPDCTPVRFGGPFVVLIAHRHANILARQIVRRSTDRPCGLAPGRRGGGCPHASR
jgi:hypothetical protein